jgi:hypothetical protein
MLSCPRFRRAATLEFTFSRSRILMPMARKQTPNKSVEEYRRLSRAVPRKGAHGLRGK